MMQTLRKYGKILRVSLVERMTYRADFFVTTLFRFLPLIALVLLWQAVYDSSGKKTLGGDETGGPRYSEEDMIGYLLLVQISRMFSSMPGLAGGIARDIRDGSLKKYLLQPIDMIAYLLSYRIAHKLAYIVAVAFPYGLLFVCCDQYLPPMPDAVTLLAYIASLLLAFLVGYFFESMIGMVGFWFLEVTSFLYVINTLNFFLSGHMFPIDLLPPFWSSIMKNLPFQYLAYFPATILLGKVQGTDLLYGLLIELMWAVIFCVAARQLYRVGLRRYSAYGG